MSESVISMPRVRNVHMAGLDIAAAVFDASAPCLEVARNNWKFGRNWATRARDALSLMPHPEPVVPWGRSGEH